MGTVVLGTNQRDYAAEKASSRLLMAYAVTGMLFMLLPGTFLGVWNLFAISSQHQSGSISPAWIQAHGHAQIFGWIGTFIIGIGYYSIAKLRTVKIFGISGGWVCWALWTAGVTLRWATNIYQWHWQLMLPLSAILEFSGFLIFLSAVSSHRRSANESKRPFEAWMLIVITGTFGLLMTLSLNLAAAICLSVRGESPAFSPGFDQRFLALTAWGFLVPFVWGFSARWLPVFLGLKELNTRALMTGFVLNWVGVAASLNGSFVISTFFLLLGAIISAIGLRLFEPSLHPAKVRGVHSSFPTFVRVAYVWLVIAALLGVWAAVSTDSNGIWGASRHALTVGFLSTMVFCIGPRVLPAFAGMRQLFSPRLMFASLALLSVGCAMRVSSEVIAYRGLSVYAWDCLPVSAVIELLSVLVFALNMACTFLQRPLVKETFWKELRLHALQKSRNKEIQAEDSPARMKF